MILLAFACGFAAGSSTVAVIMIWRVWLFDAEMMRKLDASNKVSGPEPAE